MVDITEDSGFFQQLTASQMKSGNSIRLLHDSAGGWSQLYLTDRHGRFRVLKVLKPEYRGNPMYEELLRKEFEIGYTLSHPGICEIYGFHTSAELGNCIEMEWIDGDTLASLLADNKMSAKQAKRLYGQICSAVDYLHSRQVIHRDLKPANIMVTHNGRNVRIIDFGLSDSDSFSILKAPAGTTAFAAPELVEGKATDHRADIYSLGKILEYMRVPCPVTIARCTRNNPSDRYSEPLQIMSGMRKELLVKRLAWSFCMLAVAVGTLWLVKRPESSDIPPIGIVSNDTVSQESDTVELCSEEMIDELFRQATEMVVSADGH